MSQSSPDQVSWGSVPDTTAGVERQLQRRLALFTLTVLLLSGAFLPVLLIANAVAVTPLRDWMGDSDDPAHIGGAAIALIFWLVFRSGKFSKNTLCVLDAIATVCINLAWSLMVFSADPGSRASWFVLLAFTNTVIMRAAVVPSSFRRTFVITTASAVVVVLFTQLAFVRGNPVPAAGDQAAYAVVNLTWCSVSVTVACIVSSVIFGLRRSAERALRLGQYQLMERIGQGGMGAVYRARHALLRRPTAIKLLPANLVDERGVARFEREVQATSMLRHPNTIAVYDFGRTPEGVFYYAMEYVDGLNLGQLVEWFGPVPAERTRSLLQAVCGALGEAHEQGLIHRDIKPENILLSFTPGIGDSPKLCDFGLVKDLKQGDPTLSRENRLAGTPLYLPPESIKKRFADARSDLYALGAVGYYMLAGKPVFTGNSVVEICAQHMDDVPVAPSEKLGRPLPEDLEKVILRCLEKAPEARPQSALELSSALGECHGERPWTAADATAWWDEHRESIQDKKRAESASLPSESQTVVVDFKRRRTPRTEAASRAV